MVAESLLDFQVDYAIVGFQPRKNTIKRNTPPPQRKMNVAYPANETVARARPLNFHLNAAIVMQMYVPRIWKKPIHIAEQSICIAVMA